MDENITDRARKFYKTFFYGNKLPNPDQVIELMINFHNCEINCKCTQEDQIGSTKLWCCNTCGKRQEEFYDGEFNIKKPPGSEVPEFTSDEWNEALENLWDAKIRKP